MNDINKKLSAMFLATIMITSIFVAMVTPVAANNNTAPSVTIDDVYSHYIYPGGIVNVEFTIIPSHAMEVVDITIHKDGDTIGSYSTTYTGLTPGGSMTDIISIQINTAAPEGLFHVAIKSTGVPNPACNNEIVVVKSDALKNAIHVDGTAPHKVWHAHPADNAIVEFPRTDQTIVVTVEDNIQTADTITLHYINPCPEMGIRSTLMTGIPGLSTIYSTTIDDTGVADGGTVSYWITGTDAAGNEIPETLGGSIEYPLVTYTVRRQTLSFVYVTPSNADVIVGDSLDFDFTAHDQFSNIICIKNVDAWNWSVENTRVGTIHPTTGVFTAVSKGSTEVYVDVTHHGVTRRGTATVNVELLRIISPTEANPVYAPSRIISPRNVDITFKMYTDNIRNTAITNENVVIELLDGNGTPRLLHQYTLDNILVDTMNTFDIRINIPSDILEGDYSIRVTVEDSDRSITRTKTEENAIIVDNTLPWITITETDPATFPTRENTIRVQGLVEGGSRVITTSDIGHTELHLDGTSWFAVIRIPAVIIEGRIYRFEATAIDSAGNRNITRFTFSFDRTPPGAVTTLTARPLDDPTGRTKGSILLNWTTPRDFDPCRSNLTFNVYRFITRPVGREDLIATGIRGQIGEYTKHYFSYIDSCPSLLDCGLNYSYVVRAVDKAGNIGARSNVATSARGISVDRIILTTSHDELIADGRHEKARITATVTDKHSKPVVNEWVTFSTTAGLVHPTQVRTDARGVATTTLTADALPGTAVITGTVTIAGNVIYDTVEVEFVPDSYDIELGVGWNLISLPLIPVDNRTIAVLDDIMGNVKIVWTYDAATGIWTHFRPGIGGTLELMDDGKGYWIRMRAPDTLTIDGFGLLSASAGLPAHAPPTPPPLPPAYEVVAGWNLIGFTSTEEMEAGGSFVQDGMGYGYLRSVSWKRMWTFCTEWDRLEWFDYMEPGRGYWLYVAEDGIIAP